MRSFMHSLHPFVAADFISDIAEAAKMISTDMFCLHQVVTSSPDWRFSCWQWDHRCLEIDEQLMPNSCFSCASRNSWVLAWTSVSSWSLFTAWWPNSSPNGSGVFVDVA